MYDNYEAPNKIGSADVYTAWIFAGVVLLLLLIAGSIS